MGPLIGSTVAAIVAHVLFLSDPSRMAKSFAIIRGDKDLEKLTKMKKKKQEPEAYNHIEEGEEGEGEGEEIEMRA